MGLQICPGFLDWQTGDGLADWYRIDVGLMDWFRTGRLTLNGLDCQWIGPRVV